VGPPPGDVDVAVVYSKPTVTDLVTDLLGRAAQHALSSQHRGAPQGKTLRNSSRPTTGHVRLSDLRATIVAAVRQGRRPALAECRARPGFDTAVLAVQYASPARGSPSVDGYLFGVTSVPQLVNRSDNILDDGFATI